MRFSLLPFQGPEEVNDAFEDVDTALEEVLKQQGVWRDLLQQLSDSLEGMKARILISRLPFYWIFCVNFAISLIKVRQLFCYRHSFSQKHWGDSGNPVAKER